VAARRDSLSYLEGCYQYGEGDETTTRGCSRDRSHGKGGLPDMKPLCIDLFCGLGGWAEGFLSEGYDVVGFDIERHSYGDQKYPAQLVLQDVLSLSGSRFRNADVIVASPPCQQYSYMAMPWSRAKREVAWQRWERDSPFGDGLAKLNALFNACFRIQLEASQAAGREIPLVVENVKGAQPWVGPARWHYGSYYLWGDVPALMPMTLLHQFKQPGRNFHFPEKYGIPPPSFHGAEHVVAAQRYREGVKGYEGASRHNSKSDSRKAASAMIAKIPFDLAAHIASVYKPRAERLRA
jgi:hypothetical protein